MRQHQTDVLVAGAGPVGMFMALLLAKDGIRVQIIDKEARTAGHSYACALHPRGLELLAGVGVVDDAIQAGRRVNRIAFYTGGTRSAELKLSTLPCRYPFVLVLDQSRLEDLLERKLKQNGVEIQWQHRLADLAMDESGVTGTIERLAATGKGYGVPDFGLSVEKEMETRAQFLAATDGHKSLVRERLGIKYEQAGEREMFSVFEIESDGQFDDELKIVFDRNAISVMWPLSDHKCRWSFQVPPTEMPEDFPDKERSRLHIGGETDEQAAQQRARRLLRERAPWFASNIRAVNWRTEIQFEHRLVERFGKDRCWLAGDSAHQTGPVGMQSMNAGLQEAADLTHALWKILKENDALGLLKAYGENHRAEWRRLLRLDGGPKPLPAATNWVKGNCGRIIECLPASGAALAMLMKELGLAAN